MMEMMVMRAPICLLLCIWTLPLFGQLRDIPIYDQMHWRGETGDPAIVDIGLNNSSVNLTEWAIQGEGGGPISEPNVAANRAVAEKWKSKSILVLDIEQLAKQLGEKYPNASPDQLRQMESAIRQGYYDRFKAVCPESLVLQYNQNNTQASDGIWISMYASPTDSPQSFLEKVDQRIARCQAEGKPLFVNTSPVIFSNAGNGLDAHRLMDPRQFDKIVRGLLQRQLMAFRCGTPRRSPTA